MADAASSDGDRDPLRTLSITVEELRRRNANSLAIDVLFLFTTGFLTILALQGFWPAVIAAVPLVTFLLFALRSATSFFVANLLAVGVAAIATVTGYVPF